MAIDPYRVRRTMEWSDTELDLEELGLATQPHYQRCGAVHCVDRGPWMGTLVCCVRRSGHVEEHSMSLGDIGEPDYWRESWY